MRDVGPGDAPPGGVVSSFDAEDGGFIRALVRGMTRNRTRYGEPAVGAFRVSLSQDGGVWLQDLGTHQNVDLRAFGPNQVRAFAQFVRPGVGGTTASSGKPSENR